MIKTNVYKRCWNASHRDAGVIVHIIEGAEPNGYWGGKALCGAETGKHSYGWAKANGDANCEKCIKRALVQTDELLRWCKQMNYFKKIIALKYQ